MIVAAYQAGRTLGELASQTGLNKSRIEQIVQAAAS
jgi:DNA-binding IclR family transcriptional regulator